MVAMLIHPEARRPCHPDVYFGLVSDERFTSEFNHLQIISVLSGEMCSRKATVLAEEKVARSLSRAEKGNFTAY